MIVSYRREHILNKGYDDLASLEVSTLAEKSFVEIGSDKNRPQLKAMLKLVHKGDTIICASLSRLAESQRDLLEIVQKLAKKGVRIQFLKENLEFNSNEESSTMYRIPIQVLEAFAHWEDFLKSVQRLATMGIRKGALVGRKKTNLSKIHEVNDLLVLSKLTVAEACKQVGISKATYYNLRREVERPISEGNGPVGETMATQYRRLRRWY